MIQVLKGVKIKPRGSTNRFIAQGWPNSYAFGGWIYSASVSVGFSSNPTEIKMSLVLETSSFNQTAAKFDINQDDLICHAGLGGLENETWYDIEIEGVKFENFILYEYDFSIEVNQKILNVTFKDYSIILDKIYVGLFKKQGYEEVFKYSSANKVKFPITCQDCYYNASSVITGLGVAYRNIDFASYIGTNEATKTLFEGYYYTQTDNAYDYWKKYLIDKATNPGKNSNRNNFDLNGGYLIIGTETVTEQYCNSAPDVNYNFIEFISSLRRAGLNILGDFPQPGPITPEMHTSYRANYIGPLREVLQNWCSDLGYDFYFSGRFLIGIDLKNPIDINPITQISDPTTELGQNFAIDGQGNSAILSFKTSNSLGNTFKQSVIVENSHPITEVTNQKTIKRYVNILPLHPISLNLYNNADIFYNDKNINDIIFNRPYYETKYFSPNFIAQNKQKQFFLLDGRSYRDLDTAIALSKYNDTLRDIYTAQMALKNDYGPSYDGTPYHNTDPLQDYNCRANFNALGMDPILEITDSQSKSEIISEFFSNGEKNDISNLNMDSQYFRVFLGYYNETLKNEIVNWEKKAAEAMYKYGIVTNGNLKNEPYVSPDFVLDISPTAGFYGKNGLWYNTIKNNYSPNAGRYIDHIAPPFADVLLVNQLIEQNYIPPSVRIPSGLWTATLDNQWGTRNEEFDEQLSLNLEDVCQSQYPLESNVSAILTSDTRQFQDWKLEYFRPIASPSLEKINDIIQDKRYNFDSILDGVVTTYFDNNLKEKKQCKKLHILIIPDTKTHPNLNVSFTQLGKNKINPVVLQNFKQKLYDINYERSQSKTPSVCSLSLAQEMCKNALRGEIYTTGNPDVLLPIESERKNCATFEDRESLFIDGFSNQTLTSINSRSLVINISKNPPPINGQDKIGPVSDLNGNYYYADLDTNLQISRANSVLEIIYPIECNYKNGIIPTANYLGVLSTSIETDVRMSAMNLIYGKPVNIKNNNTTSFKIINQTTDNSLTPQLNPVNNQITSFMTLINEGGGKSIISTPEQYYNTIVNLNNYNLDTPMKTVEMELAGSPNEFGTFINCISPKSGLNQMSISVTENGVRTSVSFSDRPKKLPKQEAILNKIGPRIKGTYN